MENRKLDIEPSKKPMLKEEDIKGLSEKELIDHYFNPYSKKVKLNLLNKILSNKKIDSKEKFHTVLYETYSKTYDEAVAHQDDLLKAILYTALSFECNERLKGSLFDSVFMANVHKFGKPFMKAQLDMYNKEFVQIYNASAEDLQTTQVQVEDFISFLTENVTNTSAMCILGDFAKAFNKDQKRLLEEIARINNGELCG